MPLSYSSMARHAFHSGVPSPYCASSNSDMAHRIGLYLRAEAQPLEPLDVQKSRGYTWRVAVEGALLKLSFANGTDPELVSAEADTHGAR